jgi:hypothetical protein
VHFKLIDYFQPVLSISRVKGVRFEAFYAFDSTTLSLFSQVMKSVGKARAGKNADEKYIY